MNLRRMFLYYFIPALLLSLNSAGAQDLDIPGDRPHRKNIRERIRTVRIWKLTEALNLSPDQAAKFFPRLKEFEKSMEENNKMKNEIFQKLRELSRGDKIDIKVINEKVESLAQIDQEMIRKRKEFMKGLDDILSPQQKVKYLLFERNFRKRLGEIMEDVRRRKMRGFGEPGKW